MLNLLRATLIVFLSACSAPVGAAEFQKAESKTEIYRAEGEITGCAINYTGVFFDQTYRQGGLSGVSGSVSLLKASEKSVGLFFKIAVLDWGDDITANPSFGTIANAYIRSGDESAPQKEIECENKSGFCGVSGYERAFAFFKATASNPIVVGFNRKKHAMDVQLQLPVLTNSEFEKLFKCEVDLMDSVMGDK